MTRLLRSLVLAILLPPLLAVLLAAGLVAGAHTDSGRRLLYWAVGEATDGRVRIAGLAGRLPFSPRLARIELRDAEGAWLVVQGAALDLDPWAFFAGGVTLDRLAALAVDLRRLPAGDGSGDSGLTGLPLRLEVRRAAVAALRIGPAGRGAPRLALGGRGAAGPDGFELGLEAWAWGRGDRYRLDLGLALAEGGHWRLALGIEEGPGGLLGGLLPPEARDLPSVAGPWRLWAAAVGPPERLNLKGAVAAGPFESALLGRLDIKGRSAEGLRIAVSGGASSVALPLLGQGMPEIAWERLRGVADLRGPLGAPRISMGMEADGLATGDLILGRLSARLSGGMDRLTLAADLADLAVPGLSPALLGPLVHLDLAVRRTATGWDIPAARLLGSGVTAGLNGAIAPGDLSLSWGLDISALDALVSGWAGRAVGRGALTGPMGGLDLSADLDLALERIPGLHHTGPARLAGRLEAGLAPPQGALALTGDWVGQPLALALSGRAADNGAWSLMLADLRLAGLFANAELFTAPGAGLRTRAPADPGAGPFQRMGLPSGELRLRADDLSRLAPLVAALTGGRAGGAAALALAGRLSASVSLDAGGEARLVAEGGQLRLGSTASGDRAVGLDTLDLDARIDDLVDMTGTAGTLRLGGLAVGPVSGDLLLHAAGPLRDLELAAEAALAAGGSPFDLRLAGRVHASDRRLSLEALSAQGMGVGLRLEAPAVMDLRDGLAVDRLRLALRTESAPDARRDGGTGTLDLTGRLLPELDLRARVRDAPLDLLGTALGLSLVGGLDGEAELAGPVDAPRGRLAAEVRELRFTEGGGRALPAARVDLAARLESDGTAVDARLEAGPRTRLTLRGRIDSPQDIPPSRSLSGGGVQQGAGRRGRGLDLRAEGRADLALLEPWLSAQGRHTGGDAVIDARLSGTLADPRLAGTLRLAEAALHDRALGVSVTGIAGILRLDGDALRSDRLTGRAGRGEVTLAGTVGILAPGMPADLRLVARNARLIDLDLLDADGDLELRLAGPLASQLDRAVPAPTVGDGPTLSGRVDLSRAELRIPERLPAGVATLEVRERGQRRRPITPSARGASPPPLELDVTLSAPRAVHITGRGLDAELGGRVQARGSLTRPDLAGGFELRHGAFDLAGHSLRFTRGRLDFQGGGPDQGLDPSLDLEARASAGGATAILAVQGSARSPRIELRSEPELPEDEILSRLLFGTTAGRLSGLQTARLGLAAAELAGLRGLAGIGEGRILTRARSGLGLDRLILDADEQGGAVLEGGRQLSERFYLGARQGQRAGETQGVLRIEVTPQLKLEADVGAGGGSRAGAAFQLDY